ncbi:hypothetical protein GCM10009733_024460 [Nonomuraea maheshkhaliensis]|uniref:Resolvase HTH domain-containing protein n=1 Tax=Nonomuraea maheshkhaliensis TaxID=419590 RepID=A0ABP4R275_9ACTN
MISERNLTGISAGQRNPTKISPGLHGPLEAARRRGRVGGRRPVVDDDKRAAILACRQRGESIRTIAAGVKVSIGVVHNTLTAAQAEQRA